MRKLVQRLTTTFFLTILFYSLVSLGSIAYDYGMNRKVLADARDLYHVKGERELTSLSEESKKNEPMSSFSELLSINQDMIGWIHIGNTLIDYPVLQSSDNEYYLDRNYKEEETRAGSIFLDYRNDMTANPKHTILYGHRMKDASMFSGLTKFMEEDFFRDPPTMYFDTLFEQYDLEVFSAYQTSTDFYYIETEFETDHVYNEFLEEIRSRSLFDSDVVVNVDDQIITLSTCDYTLHPSEGRFVVHAKLVKR
ncbi:class B sortase [Alkalicoccobacillus gibsonii]|uniref:class B sortase n=1 Tax=Alkalicoccobacillus gibsonii TaxID=79881 RepID=UPI003F7B598A